VTAGKVSKNYLCLKAETTQCLYRARSLCLKMAGGRRVQAWSRGHCLAEKRSPMAYTSGLPPVAVEAGGRGCATVPHLVCCY
jgi:hypothetical protein